MKYEIKAITTADVKELQKVSRETFKTTLILILHQMT